MIRGNLTGTLFVAALRFAAPAAASPEDPFGEDWVAIAIAPKNGVATYGGAGNPDRATQIAVDECNQRATGHRCTIVTSMQYGCVAYALNTDTQSWAGGRGPDPDAAVADATTKMPPFNLGDVIAGSQCSTPVTPP